MEVVEEKHEDNTTPRKNFSEFVLSEESLKEEISKRNSTTTSFDIPSSTTVNIEPFAPEEFPSPDISSFEVPVSGMDSILFVMQRIEKKIRIPIFDFLLFTSDGKYQFAETGYLVGKFDLAQPPQKTLYMVLNQKPDIKAMKDLALKVRKEASEKELSSLLSRKWRKAQRPDDVKQEEWDRYISTRDEVERETEDFSETGHDEKSFKQDYIESIRRKALKVFNQSHRLPEKFQTDDFKEMLSESIYPFHLKNDGFYTVNYFTRIYSPVILGNSVDVWMAHHQRARWSYIESYNALEAIKVNIHNDQSTKPCRDLERSDNEKNLLIGFDWDEDRNYEERKMAHQYKINRFKKHLFGKENDSMLSDRRFMRFLCTAAGFSTIDLEGDTYSVGSVFRMIKRCYTPHPESDDEDDSDLNSEGSNEPQEPHMDSDDENELGGGRGIDPIMMANLLRAQTREGGGEGQPGCPQQ